jgi:iterative type I PKS product template protein
MASTGMVALNLGAAAVRDELRSSELFSKISIACYNSPVDSVVSGPLEQLAAFQAHLDSTVHCKNVLLAVPFGYHSSAMSPLLADLSFVSKNVTIRPPAIPVICNVFGNVVAVGDNSVFNAHYFVRHCAEPVHFDKGVRALAAFANIDACIEIGPHTTCLPMLGSNAVLSKDALLIGSLRKQQDAWTTLTISLSRLYVSNVIVNWRKVFSHLSSVSCVWLPSYPFSNSKFWVPFVEEHTGVVSNTACKDLVSYSMLHTWVQRPCSANGFVAIFETPITILAGAIRGHKVGGMPLCPASVYVEQILEGVHLVRTHLGFASDDSHVVLRRMGFAKPLVYDSDVARIVITTVTLNGDSGVFNISSRLETSDAQLVHVMGDFRIQLACQTILKLSRVLPVLTRKMSSVVDPNRSDQQEVFSTRTAYEVIFPRVVDYAREYHTIQSLTVDSSGMECCASVKLPGDYSRGKYVVHPVFVDTLLHVAGFVANMRGGINDAYICSEVGSVKVIPELVDNDASYAVFCSMAWLPDEGIVLAEAYAVEANGFRKIVAHVKDMHFRRIGLNSLKRGLARAVGVSDLQGLRKSSSPVPLKNVALRTPSRDIDGTGDIQREVLKVVSTACDIDASAINVHANLASLGVDSLMTVEILRELQTAFPEANFSTASLSSCRSVVEIAREVSAKWLFTSPESQQASSGPSSPRTLVHDEKPPSLSVLNLDDEPDVKRVLASVLDVGLQEINDDTDFVSLGLDSLTSIEALAALKNEFGIDLPSNIFRTCPTARGIQAYLSGHVKSNLTSIANVLRLRTLPVPLQTSMVAGRTPLFVIHDGSGLINYYDRLSPLARPVWGIHNPRFITGQPWDGIISMAVSYAEYVYDTLSEPVILGGTCRCLQQSSLLICNFQGWSFGGVVAFETARQLLKRGVDVKGVVLVDTPSPLNHVPLSDSLLDSIINLDTRSVSSEIGRLIKSQFEMNSRMLGEYDPLIGGAPYPPLAFLRSRKGFNPSSIPNIPKWLKDRSSEVKQATAGWEMLVGTSVKVWDIPGHHFEPFHASNVSVYSYPIS